MSRRLLIVLALTTGAAALSGCVVVPAEPAYGYGQYGYRAPPAAVVVVPPPRPRYWGGYYGGGYYGGGYYGDRGWHR